VLHPHYSIVNGSHVLGTFSFKVGNILRSTQELDIIYGACPSTSALSLNKLTCIIAIAPLFAFVDMDINSVTYVVFFEVVF
jgi:hypothetical protein